MLSLRKVTGPRHAFGHYKLAKAAPRRFLSRSHGVCRAKSSEVRY